MYFTELGLEIRLEADVNMKTTAENGAILIEFCKVIVIEIISSFFTISSLLDDINVSIKFSRSTHIFPRKSFSAVFVHLVRLSMSLERV
mmetsp:Transcript_12435/g.12057  ORF Transcript_12435/g.12057 Transcript_12435/m.12057 type:complete len:89 (-) Transcript_12435:68-334(-)